MVRDYDIVSILKRVIPNMIIKVCVKSSTDNGDGTFNIEVCDSKYLYECFHFVYNNVDYFVEEVNDKIVTIKGSVLIDSDFNIPPPLFIPDSPRGVNSNMKLRRSDPRSYPLIWMLENFTTRYDLNNRLYVSKPRVKLFFLIPSRDEEWLEDDIRKHSIEPMLSLCDDFINELEDKVSGQIKQFTVFNRLRFGKVASNKSNDSKIIDDNISGVELDIEIPVKKWAVQCHEC